MGRTEIKKLQRACTNYWTAELTHVSGVEFVILKVITENSYDFKAESRYFISVRKKLMSTC